MSYKRKQRASTGALGRFGTGIVTNPRPRDYLHDEAPEDIRFERFTEKVYAEKTYHVRSDASRQKKVYLIYEDSPNDYEITSKEPSDITEAIKYYSLLLLRFDVKFPDEYAICHFAMAKLFMKEKRMTTTAAKAETIDDRSRNIENSLFHFEKALSIWTYYSHPILFAVISTMIGQLSRERIIITTQRGILGSRGESINTINKALAQVSEALPLLKYTENHSCEHAICCLEIGWLYRLLQTEDEESAKDIDIREQSITLFERCIGLVEDIKVSLPGKGRPRDWDPFDISTHPSHIDLLLRGRSLNDVSALAQYMLGCVYHDWGLNVTNQRLAFDAFSKALSPSMLQPDTEYWMDAHHRIAKIVILTPEVVDEDFKRGSGVDSAVNVEVAITHLRLAARSNVLSGTRSMDINFHLAQAFITKLYGITDFVPAGQSVTKAIADNFGLDVIKDAENAMIRALRHVTGANTQSTQDAYCFFFCCLKLAEFRMLEAALLPDITLEERNDILEESVLHVVNALHSRSLADNFDLHYMATLQMAQMVMAVKKGYASMKTYAKAVMCLGAMVNRAQFNSDEMLFKLFDESQRMTGQALFASIKESKWTKDHLGHTLIVETGEIVGYANWAFEVEPLVGDQAEVTAKNAPKKNNRPPDYPMPLSAAVVLPESPDKSSQALTVVSKSGSPVPKLDLKPLRPLGAPPTIAFGQKAGFSQVKRMYDDRNKRRIPRVAEIEAASEIALMLKRQGVRHELAKQQTGVYFRPAGVVLSKRHKQKYKNKKIKRKTTEDDYNSDDSEISGSSSDEETVAYHHNGSKAQKLQFEEESDDNNSDNDSDHTFDPKVKIKGEKIGFIQQLTNIIEEKLKMIDRFFEEYAPSVTSKLKKVGKDIRIKVKGKTEEEKELVKEKSELWASSQCLYLFMMLSRLHRLDLVLRSASIKASTGERCKYIMNKGSTHVKMDLLQILKTLQHECSDAPVPPTTLRELSSRSFDELKLIFQSKPHIYRLLTELEKILYDQIKQEDFFIPMSIAANTLTSNIQAFDKALLNAETFMGNLKNEDANKKKVIISNEFVRADVIKKLTAGEEDEESEKMGRMTYSLSQSLDGTGMGDARDLFEKFLEEDECMIVWHMPTTGTHNIMCVLIWRDSHVHLPTEKRYAEGPPAEGNGKTYGTFADEGNDPIPEKIDVGDSISGIIMEMAKTDINAHRLNSILQGYIDALHTTPQPLRTSKCTDALFSLSSILCMSELLQMIPTHIKSLIMCCPGPLRIIPWHLLLIEEVVNDNGEDDIDLMKSGGKQRKVEKKIKHLIDNYLVRLGPSLSLFEMACLQTLHFKQEHGMHRMCCIDGEDGDTKAHGLRGTEIEIACVTTTFAADPGDYNVIMGPNAAAFYVKTGAVNRLSMQEKLALRRLKEKEKMEASLLRAEENAKRYINTEESSSESDSSDSDTDSDTEKERSENRKFITDCRVLHWASPKIKLDLEKSRYAALLAPSKGKARLNNDGTRKKPRIGDEKQEFMSTDVISNLFVRNCALCVLSRYSLTDDITILKQVDANIEFVEAVIMAGATTVMYPIWSGISQGALGVLGSQIVLIRMYTELPFHSKKKTSIATALQQAQIWLREATTDEVRAFLYNAPLPKKARKELATELDAYVKAASGGGNGVGTSNKYFNHFLYWGNMTLCGQGGGVHHPDIANEDYGHEDINAGNKGGRVADDDEEMKDIRFEASVLRMEGRYAEAAELEQTIRRMAFNKVKTKLLGVKRAAGLLQRGFVDTFEVLDKLLLVQDSDSIDSDSSGEKRRLEEKKKASDLKSSIRTQKGKLNKVAVVDIAAIEAENRKLRVVDDENVTPTTKGVMDVSSEESDKGDSLSKSKKKEIKVYSEAALSAKEMLDMLPGSKKEREANKSEICVIS